jgi:hypothetical protein
LTVIQTEEILSRLLGINQLPTLPRSKATISWSDNEDIYDDRPYSDGYPDPSIILNIGGPFRYGSDDILRLARAIHQFREEDDIRSDGERSSVDGLFVNIWSNPSSIGNQYFIGKGADSALFSQFNIPREITVNAPVGTMSGQALVAAYLDMAAPASGSRQTIKMHLANVDQLIAYARAVSVPAVRLHDPYQTFRISYYSSDASSECVRNYFGYITLSNYLVTSMSLPSFRILTASLRFFVESTFRLST